MITISGENEELGKSGLQMGDLPLVITAGQRLDRSLAKSVASAGPIHFRNTGLLLV